MNWIDSHCHLDFEVFNEPLILNTNLRESGCAHVLVPAISEQYFSRVQKFQIDANQHHKDLVYIALGLHPYFLKEHKAPHLERLDCLLSEHRPMAVGEIGLDFALPPETHESQIALFEAQVLLAKKHQLTIVVHARSSHDRVCSILKRHKFINGGIIHAFSGSFQQAQNYLRLGFVLGLGGALTYDRARAMHKMVQQLPSSAYVLETDSPDMAPAFARGQVNTPMNIPKIAQSIANLRGEALDKVYQDSTDNFMRVMLPSNDPV